MPEGFEATRERWLKEEIRSRLDEMNTDPSIGIPAEQIFAELEAHHLERMKPSDASRSWRSGR